jgi:hypothetical protein
MRGPRTSRKERKGTSGLAVVFAAEQIGHDGHIGVAGVIQTGQPETSLQRLGEGEVGIERVARYTMTAVVRIHDRDNLVGWGATL